MSEKREGALFYDKESRRYDIRFGIDSVYGGLHCGDCFDLKVDNAWVPARIEIEEEFVKAYQRVTAGEITQAELKRELGLSHTTFYRYRKKYFEKNPEIFQSQKK